PDGNPHPADGQLAFCQNFHSWEQDKRQGKEHADYEKLQSIRHQYFPLQVPLTTGLSTVLHKRKNRKRVYGYSGRNYQYTKNYTFYPHLSTIPVANAKDLKATIDLVYRATLPCC
ncbi:MAG: hypothetical protein KAI73_00625, partial [Rhodospirillaceae bacterium]|nr:hypothetical protein [Rhodospirillaceae bacterium]